MRRDSDARGAIRGARLFSCGLLAACAVLSAAPAVAEIRVEAPWIRPTPPGAPVEAFATLVNDGADPDRLLSAHVAAAEGAAFGRAVFNDGRYVFEPVAAIDAPADAVVTLRPRRLHIRFEGVTARLYLGAEVPATFIFERAGAVEVVFIVQDGPSAGLGLGRGDLRSGDHGPGETGPAGHDRMMNETGLSDGPADGDFTIDPSRGPEPPRSVR